MDDDALIARRVVSDEAQVYGAPVYLDRMGRPATASELVDHQCIVRFDGGWRPRTRWPLRAGGEVSVQAGLTTNELVTRLDAAITGMGLALLPSHLARIYVRSGQLEPVMPEWICERSLMQLVYSSKRLLLPQARAFIDFAVERSAASSVLVMTTMTAARLPTSRMDAWNLRGLQLRWKYWPLLPTVWGRVIRSLPQHCPSIVPAFSKVVGDAGVA